VNIAFMKSIKLTKGIGGIGGIGFFWWQIEGEQGQAGGLERERQFVCPPGFFLLLLSLLLLCVDIVDKTGQSTILLTTVFFG
jgi:hypothetical protein